MVIQQAVLPKDKAKKDEVNEAIPDEASHNVIQQRNRLNVYRQTNDMVFIR